MAEAAVAEPLPARFYCHVCNVEINIPNTDFTCPLCSGGFVEELPPNAPAGSPMVASNAGPLADRDDPYRIADLRNEIATLLMSRNGGDPFNMTHVSGPQYFLGLDDHPSGSQHNVQSGGNSGGGGQSTPAAAHSRPIVQIRQPNLGGLDTFLMDFLQTLTNGTSMTFGNGSGRDGTNPSSTFWMGNLGDYAWGREGIDTIVTQLLNQMETSGPPPLARDKIDAIPKVEVSEEDVQRKLQCSVCWEDFKLSELVRKLPCSHIYHDNCIVPWLDLHGTCPICRKSLSDEEEAVNAEDATGADSNMEMNDLNHPCPHFRRRNAPANPSSTTAASTATTATNTERRPGEPAPNQTQRSDEQQQPQQQQQQQSATRNNVFTFDDSNMDLD